MLTSRSLFLLRWLFLDFLCDSMHQVFLITLDKTKFATLRESILSSFSVSLKTLQHSASKAVSFSLAIPGCKLYVHKVFNAISQLMSSSNATAKVQGGLCLDVPYRHFLTIGQTACLEGQSNITESPCSVVPLNTHRVEFFLRMGKESSPKMLRMA